MELLLADIDPHVVRVDHHVRITREAQTPRVKIRGHLLVRHEDVDVLHADNIAHIISCAIVRFVVHRSLLWL